ncbi:diguanylate cyclase (GGDEF)-like protein/PAS domain S-box-containing protein [Alkalibacillus flavidus]|uniref:Diguanylate cyclase (GGDEF)-like protein/PAS domain S-box-containing protein n=1 Tax=Alkalibacillus flavidus TaxID=546021 RepID=A0ABV2KX04_9BACI
MNQKLDTSNKNGIWPRLIFISIIMLVGQFVHDFVDWAVGGTIFGEDHWPVVFDLAFIILIVIPIIYEILRQQQRHIRELEYNQRFMNSIFDSMYEGVSVIDRQGNMRRVNNVVRDYIDVDYDEYIPYETWTSYVDYYNPDTNRQLNINEIPIFRALNGETVVAQRVIAQSENGVTKHLSVNGKPLTNDQGEFIGAVTVAHDITQHVEMEAKLLESEQQYRALIEFLPDAVIVQQSNKILFTNQRGAEMLVGEGAERSDLVGRHIDEFIEPGEENKLIQHLSDFDEQDGITSPVEQTILRSDGTKLEVESIGVPIQFQGKPAILTIDRDITERKQIEQALSETSHMYEMIANNMNDLIALITPEGDIQYTSPSHKIVLGFEGQDYFGHQAESIIHPDDRVTFDHMLTDIVTYGVPKREEYRVRHRSGAWIWVEVKGAPIFDQNDTQVVKEILIVSREITDRKELEDKLKHLAYYDELTGLPNRKSLEDYLKDAMNRSKRSGDRIATFFIDLDGFKEVNDQLGHEAGDQLLKIVADRFRQSLRDDDFVARFGGDEFTVILEDVDENKALEVAHRIYDSLSKPIPLTQQDAVVTPSIGIGLYPKDASDIAEVLSKADYAMYVAKNNDHSFYQFYREDLPSVQELKMNPVEKLINHLRKS